MINGRCRHGSRPTVGPPGGARGRCSRSHRSHADALPSPSYVPPAVSATSVAGMRRGKG
jgi:hypothetical protein